MVSSSPAGHTRIYWDVTKMVSEPGLRACDCSGRVLMSCMRCMSGILVCNVSPLQVASAPSKYSVSLFSVGISI